MAARQPMKCVACGDSRAPYYITATLSEPGASFSYKRQCPACFRLLLSDIDRDLAAQAAASSTADTETPK